MKDKAFVEKGLGMLHLKKVEGDDTKTQMVVRAETNLGKIYFLKTVAFISGKKKSSNPKNFYSFFH
jgi:hypothetical protein